MGLGIFYSCTYSLEYTSFYPFSREYCNIQHSFKTHL